MRTELDLLCEVRAELTRSLVRWAGVSVVVGAPLWWLGRRNGSATAVGVGRQTLAWGAVDLAIAAAGSVANRRPVPDPPAAVRSLRRLLWVNAVLDIGYLLGAVLLSRRSRLAPDAAGIAVQGTALLIIDTVHARRLRMASNAAPAVTAG